MLVENKKTPMKTQKKVIIIMIVAAVAAAIIFAVVSYINDFYKANHLAGKAMLGNENIEVTEEDTYYRFANREEEREADKGIIFYPGGKVEETAYAPLLLALAEEGYEVYLVKMPAKLAILGSDRADVIIDKAEHITEWTMMGHSLGGAMAAGYSASHDAEIDNLVLLAAYSMDDLTDLDMDVYSFYGSEDKVLNMDSYKKYYDNLPADMVETVIDGGNHAYYGNYGEQDGDGTATISPAEQQESVLDIFLTLEN